MAELVLVVCLMASPGVCQEERPLLDQVPLMACVAQGQQYAQEWLADHPKWALSRWRCEHDVPRQQPS